MERIWKGKYKFGVNNLRSTSLLRKSREKSRLEFLIARNKNFITGYQIK